MPLEPIIAPTGVTPNLPDQPQPSAVSLDSLAALVHSLTERPAPVKTAPTTQSSANAASVAPEPQSNTAMAAATKRRRKLRMEREDRSEAKEKRNRGRPARYRQEYSDFACKLALEGYTHRCVAYFFGVSLVTIYHWQKRYPPFKKAIDTEEKKRN